MSRHIVLFMMVILFLSGCYDKKEVEEQAYVVALGLDQGKEGKLKVTYQIANPEVGSAAKGGQANEDPYEIVTFETNDFVSARDTSNAFITRKVTYEHLDVIITHEDLAKTEQFLRLMYVTTKDKSIRRNTKLIFTKEPAAEFLKQNKPILETRPHKYFQFMTQRTNETGLVPEANIQRFLTIAEGDADLFLGMYASTVQEEENKRANEDEFLAGQINKEGGNPTQFIGSAVFKEGKMIGKLTGEQTRLALILDETLNMSDIITTYPDPLMDEYRIAVRLMKSKSNK
ncbi:Ger(x)C family spore germination protein [Bacillus coahuilensis]|nr:Ger(x)C family spore germination C-terminal domain-containing protein [Bacillus coahuilensis]